MALGMYGAGGSWDDEEKKKKHKVSTLADGVYGTDGKARGLAQQAAPANRPENAVLGMSRTPTPDPKRYPISQAAKDKMSGQLTGMGIKTDNPFIKDPADKGESWNPKDYPSVYAGKPSAPTRTPAEDTIEPSYADNAPAKIGFNPAKQGARTPAIAPQNIGFRMPNAPVRSMADQQEREALLRDTRTPYKGAQNGQLTSRQLELRAGILNNEDKYKNDQYNAQLGAAANITQTGMTQDGANARAALGEQGSNERLNTQLGFDAVKFQQTTDQQQQANNLNSRRLDMQQANDEISNYSAKKLNSLYEQYDAAKGEWEKGEIAKQIQALKGTSSDKEYWTNIGGGETATADGLGSVKNPDILLNRNTGETRAIPKEPIDYATDERAQAIINNTSLSKEERRKQLEALR